MNPMVFTILEWWKHTRTRMHVWYGTNGTNGSDNASITAQFHERNNCQKGKNNKKRARISCPRMRCQHKKTKHKTKQRNKETDQTFFLVPFLHFWSKLCLCFFAPAVRASIHIVRNPNPNPHSHFHFFLKP